MFSKNVLFIFFSLCFLHLNAQNTNFNSEMHFEKSTEMGFSDFDYSKVSNLNGFNYEITATQESIVVNKAGHKNLMLLENLNQSETEAYLNMMLKRRHPMEKTGRILTYIGVPLAIIGGIMVAGADELYYNCVNGDCTGDARGGFGVVLLGAGSGLSITGTVLWIIGSKK